jgi:hypothetical protein
MDLNERTVTDRVFDAFIKDLEGAGVDESVRQRLRKALLEDRKYTDPALKAAVFGDGETSL